MTIRNLTPHTIPDGTMISTIGVPGDGQQLCITDFRPGDRQAIAVPLTSEEAERFLDEPAPLQE